MPYPAPRPAPPNGPGTCPRCHDQVIWCVTTKNRVALAVNPDRDPSGNQAVRTDHTGRWIARQLTTERPTPEGGEALHIPHIATCPIRPASSPRPTAPRQRRGIRPTPTWWRR